MNVINHEQLLEIHGGIGVSTVIKELHHVMIVQEAINYVVGFYLNGPAEDDYIGHAIVGGRDMALDFLTSSKDTVVGWFSGSHSETCSI